jgi:hypothetical protein
MKQIIALILTLVSGASFLHADTAEFERLQASYKDALDKATKPLTQTYLRELERLRDSYTRSANLEGAQKVQTEIDSLTRAAAFANVAKKAPTAPPTPVAAPPVSAKEAAAATMPPELHWFVGKTWLTDALTKWNFEKDGTGSKSRSGQKTGSIFKWRVLGSGLVELSEQAAPGKPVSITLLRFKDRNEAWFGGTPDKLNARLHYP